jgi:hypothetical protein
MDLYGQEPEASLLGAFISVLEHKTVVDVGAERGVFAKAMLAAGADHVHAIESTSESQRALTERFGDEPRVTVRGPGLDELPPRVGVLKIAGQGRESELLAETAGLSCDIVLLERPHDPSGRNVHDIAEGLRLRGFMHFALVGRQDGSPFVLWNDGDAPSSAGLLIFVHARVLGRIVPLILEFAARLAERTTEGRERDAAFDEQQRRAIEGLKRIVYRQAAAADERLEAIEELIEAVNALTRERDIQAEAAAERLATILRLAAAEEEQSRRSRVSV